MRGSGADYETGEVAACTSAEGETRVKAGRETAQGDTALEEVEGHGRVEGQAEGTGGKVALPSQTAQPWCGCDTIHDWREPSSGQSPLRGHSWQGWQSSCAHPPTDPLKSAGGGAWRYFPYCVHVQCT